MSAYNMLVKNPPEKTDFFVWGILLIYTLKMSPNIHYLYRILKQLVYRR